MNITSRDGETHVKPAMLRYIAYALLAVGIFALTACGGGVRDFDNWYTHTESVITMRIPNANVDEDSHVDPDMPQVTTISVISETRAVEVGLIRTEGFDGFIPIEFMSDIAYELMLLGAAEISDDVTTSSGTMQGFEFQSGTGLANRSPFEFRTFVIGGEVYILFIAVNREADSDLIGQFFDSVRINA